MFLDWKTQCSGILISLLIDLQFQCNVNQNSKSIILMYTGNLILKLTVLHTVENDSQSVDVAGLLTAKMVT